jgi:hypothetical protein
MPTNGTYGGQGKAVVVTTPSAALLFVDQGGGGGAKWSADRFLERLTNIAFCFDIFQFPFWFNPGTNRGNVETRLNLFGLFADS